MTQSNPLPHWDMTVLYPSVDSKEFENDLTALIEDIENLRIYFEESNIKDHAAPQVNSENIKHFEYIIENLNDIFAKGNTIRAYIASFIATDSRNPKAQKQMSRLQQNTAKLSMLATRFIAWVGSFDVEKLKEKSEVAQEYSFMLSRYKIAAKHLMSHEKEELASKLSLTGSTAWTKLYSTYASQIMVPIALEDVERKLPISAVRNLAHSHKREIRKRAYEAELEGWKKNAVPIAAALNAIKGEQNTLLMEQGWTSPFEKALFTNNISRETFNAMMETAREFFPDFRRYMKAKAKAMNLDQLAWFDMFAPIDTESKEWQFDESANFIVKQFGTFSDKLKGLADRAFRENWIDAESREGKRDGAFCMKLRGDESRILCNYKYSFDGLNTLAHELGHAYHNVCLANRPFLQKNTPMTLAETASIFCEMIVKESAIKTVEEHEKLMILEATLQDACQTVVDIYSRYLFEKKVYEKRLEREISVDELCEFMEDAQKETYGDGLDGNYLHPYMWAAKPHYYGPIFYNFPYMFGLLFGLGLYSEYLKDPEKFKAMYDGLLSSTGMAMASDLAERFGIDIKTHDFWRSSLEVIQKEIDKFENIIG